MMKSLGQSEPGTRVTTPSKVITQTEVELFCAITGVNLPMFLSEASALAKGWSRRIVPVPYTFSCSMGLVIQSGVFYDIVAFLELDEMKATAAVYIGDCIHVELELLSRRLTKAGDKGIIIYQWGSFNQDGKLVLQGKLTEMYKVETSL